MFTKLKRKILSFSLACTVIISASSCPVFATTKTNVTNTKPVQVEIGKSASFKLHQANKNVTNPDPIAESKYTWTGDGGTSELTPSLTYVHYDVNTFVYSSGFVGSLSITDLTSGFSCGTTLLTKFSGNVPYQGKSGHQYRATLSGTAFDGFEPVAVVPDGASIMWTN